MNPYKMVIAVANQKGGCAKTTTAVNLAAALAKGSKKQGLPPAKVLLIDLDPQGNCATSFGVEKKKVKKTAYDLLVNDGGEELPLMDEYLISPQEKIKIKVDQYPFLITEMKVIGNNWKQTIFFTTNVGEQFEVTEHNPITIELDKTECVPFVHIRNGLNAGICRSVYYRLADLIVSKEEEVGFWSAGSFQTIRQS